jgi:hypothetical protein
MFSKKPTDKVGFFVGIIEYKDISKLKFFSTHRGLAEVVPLSE